VQRDRRKITMSTGANEIDFETELQQYLISGKKILLKVKTNMAETKIMYHKSVLNGKDISLVMQVHAIPEQNKANIEIIKFFSKQFKTKVRIVKGLTNREKLLEVI